MKKFYYKRKDKQLNEKEKYEKEFNINLENRKNKKNKKKLEIEKKKERICKNKKGIEKDDKNGKIGNKYMHKKYNKSYGSLNIDEFIVNKELSNIIKNKRKYMKIK